MYFPTDLILLYLTGMLSDNQKTENSIEKKRIQKLKKFKRLLKVKKEDERKKGKSENQYSNVKL